MSLLTWILVAALGVMTATVLIALGIKLVTDGR
jgi:hypothetical protein